MTFNAMWLRQTLIKYTLLVTILALTANVLAAGAADGSRTAVDAEASLAQAWISAIGSDRVDELIELSDKHGLSKLLAFNAPNGKSALMVACKKGNLALAKKLVAKGASVHDTTTTNGTALMFAILGDQRQTVEWLYDVGADINVVGSNGWSALTVAAAKGNADLLKWLLDRGAAAQIRDVYRYTPLLRAVENGYLETATILLALPKTDVNAQDEYDNTALHHAVSSANVAMVRLLIDNGADADVENRQGLSARDLASGISALELELQRSR